MARHPSAARARPALVTLAALGLAIPLGAAACKKEGSRDGATTVTPRGPVIDVSKLAVPRLFAQIPTDTPYLLASFEGMPVAYFEKVRAAFGPVMSAAADQLTRANLPDELRRWVDALTSELTGKLDEKGLASLGIALRGRYALYGHGLWPVVLRMELADDKALLATIERVAAKTGTTLPPRETRHGRSFWRIELPEQLGAIVSIADGHLVAALGPRPAIAAALPQILGAERPAANLGDGKPLKDLIVKHQLGALMLGYVDTQRVVREAVALRLGGEQPPAACGGALDGLAAAVPRLAFGYSEVSGTQLTAKWVVELAAGLAADVAKLQTAVTGFDAAFAGSPLFALGGGVDLTAGVALVRRAAIAMRGVGAACESESLARDAAELVDKLAAPLPPPLAGVRGMAFAIQDLELPAGGGMPRRMDGVLVIGADDAPALYSTLAAQIPFLRDRKLTATGKLEPLEVPELGLPFELHAGMSARAIALTAGAGKQRGQAALADRATPAPLLAMAMDYGRFFELQGAIMPGGPSANDPLQRSMLDAFRRTFGAARMSVEVASSAVVGTFSVELK